MDGAAVTAAGAWNGTIRRLEEGKVAAGDGDLLVATGTTIGPQTGCPGEEEVAAWRRMIAEITLALAAADAVVAVAWHGMIGMIAVTMIWTMRMSSPGSECVQKATRLSVMLLEVSAPRAKVRAALALRKTAGRGQQQLLLETGSLPRESVRQRWSVKVKGQLSGKNWTRRWLKPWLQLARLLQMRRMPKS